MRILFRHMLGQIKKEPPQREAKEKILHLLL
nr:MAG TPA: hypothetical protein [Caudoviricetes sp.]